MRPYLGEVCRGGDVLEVMEEIAPPEQHGPLDGPWLAAITADERTRVVAQERRCLPS
jgi:hypothetical protein